MPQDARERHALDRIKEFSSKVRALVDRVTADDLIERAGVNPYLVKALGLKTIEEVVEFAINRRVERSLGTSFGNVLDDTIGLLLGGVKGKEQAKATGAKWLAWWDVILVGNRAVLSVKSGPADMDKDQVEYFAQRAREAEKNGYRPYLVFAYGKQAFSVIETYLRQNGLDPSTYLRIGKAVFEEFLGDPTYHLKAMGLFGVAGAGVGDLFTLIDGKAREVTEELKKRYGGDVNKMLMDMF